MSHEDLPAHWILVDSWDPVRYPESDAGQKRIERLLENMSIAEIIFGKSLHDPSFADDEDDENSD